MYVVSPSVLCKFKTWISFQRWSASLCFIRTKTFLSVLSWAYCICLHLCICRWSGVDEFCGWRCQEVTRCTHKPTQTAPPGRRVSLLELQAYRERVSTAPPNRMKILGNAVWAQRQIFTLQYKELRTQNMICLGQVLLTWVFLANAFFRILISMWQEMNSFRLSYSRVLFNPLIECGREETRRRCLSLCVKVDYKIMQAHVQGWI